MNRHFQGKLKDMELDFLAISDEERGDVDKSLSLSESLGSSLEVSTESIECLKSTNINLHTCIEERQYALDLIYDCREGLKCYGLEASENGSGGVYFIKSANNARIAVFKPEDEEAFAPNNPKGRVGRLGQTGLRNGIRSGEAACREVAAYYLDRNGFTGVPFTFLAEISDGSLNYTNPSLSERGMYAKRGSLQEYFHHQDHIEDLSPCLFSSEQIHRIALLDILICNTDRNPENILVHRSASGEYHLVPIDHGYCLPDTLEIGWCDWIWIDWPQAMAPFSEECVRHVMALDADEYVPFLRGALGIRDECTVNMRIMVKVLQLAVTAGMNLHQIARIVCRDNLDVPSLLEKTVTQARALALLNQPVRKTFEFDQYLSVSTSARKQRRLRRNSSAQLSSDAFYDLFFLHFNVLVQDLIHRKAFQWKVRTLKSTLHRLSSATPSSLPARLPPQPSPKRTLKGWSSG